MFNLNEQSEDLQNELRLLSDICQGITNIITNHSNQIDSGLLTAYMEVAENRIKAARQELKSSNNLDYSCLRFNGSTGEYELNSELPKTQMTYEEYMENMGEYLNSMYPSHLG